MKRKFPKLLAAVLALVMVFSLAACGSNNTPPSTPTDAPVATTAPTEAPAEPVVEPEQEAEPEPEPVKTDVPLVVKEDYFSKMFTPFFSQTVPDLNVYGQTVIGLMKLDRAGEIVWNGIEGETRTYNGEPFTYKNIADLSQDYDEEADITTYRAKIREDLVFSDGVPVTIDDLIFTYYVYLDPSYTGSTTLYSVDIVGLDAYRNQLSEQYGAAVRAMVAAGPDHEWSDSDEWSEEMQNDFWAEFKTAWVKVCQDIVDYCVTNYADGYADMLRFSADEIKSNPGLGTAFGMLVWGFGDVTGETEEVENEDGEMEEVPVEGADVIFVGGITGREWNLTAGEYPTVEDYYTETYEAYGGDIEAFTSVEEPNGNTISLSPMIFKYTREVASEAGGELSVKSVEGIRRINDYEVEVLVNGYNASAVYQVLGLDINPLHYYGDKSLYNPENGTYGFEYGNLDIVHSKDTQPMGAGPYIFKEYSNNVAYFEANPLYWEGEPKIKFLQLKECPPTEDLTGIVAGTHDISDVSYSPDNKQLLLDSNPNGEMTGEVITTSMVDYRGYGYIGLNTSAVSVDGERGSEASKNLRKALATVLAVHRDTANNSYYGEAAVTINYPISNTNWAAPQATDPGYEVAYSKDVAGNPIYTPDMTADQKYEAARQAALGFLEAAGYTIEDGKAVAGPSEVRKTNAGDMSYLEFEAYVGADGTSDHPVFAVYTDFKESMAQIGINIIIQDIAFSNMTNAVDEELCDIWAMAWQATIDPDMYQVYHGSNIIGAEGSTGSNLYGICDPLLDQLILDARKSDDQAYRKAIYKQAMDIVLDWGVEVPNYQRKNFECFSTQRVNTDTITPVITTNWGWGSEIQLLEMR